MSNKVDIMFPVGRLVGGSLVKGKDKDYEGRPLVYKTGEKKGQPRLSFSIGVAIAKKPDHTSWAQTEWGAKIYQAGLSFFPNGAATREDFSWKINNGDDTKVDDKGKRYCDREGYAGHWVLWFSQSQPIKACDALGKDWIDAELIKPGYYVQVKGNIDGNESVGNPGVYLNPDVVAYSAPGPVISLGLDLSELGFGGELPPGVSAIPEGMTETPAVASNTLPGQQRAAASTLPGAKTVVQPNTAILGAGTVPKPPGAAAVLHKMTAAAGANTYEMFIAEGWDDASLIAAGYMLA